jgi:hypothetical protein
VRPAGARSAARSRGPSRLCSRAPLSNHGHVKRRPASMRRALRAAEGPGGHAVEPKPADEIVEMLARESARTARRGGREEASMLPTSSRGVGTVAAAECIRRTAAHGERALRAQVDERCGDGQL